MHLYMACLKFEVFILGSNSRLILIVFDCYLSGDVALFYEQCKLKYHVGKLPSYKDDHKN